MPKGTPGRKRVHRVSARLNDAELAACRAVATQAGFSEMGTWIRQVLTEELIRSAGNQPPARAMAVVDRQACRVLQGMGSNLNQLTRLANMDKRAPDTRRLQHVTEAVLATLDFVRGKPRRRTQNRPVEASCERESAAA